MASKPVRKFKHKTTGHEAIAVLPREVVTLKAAGYVEDKPKSEAPKPAAPKADPKN